MICTYKHIYILRVCVCMLASVPWIWAMLICILFDDIHLFRQSMSLWTGVFSFSYTHLNFHSPNSQVPLTLQIVHNMLTTCERLFSYHLCSGQQLMNFGTRPRGKSGIFGWRCKTTLGSIDGGMAGRRWLEYPRKHRLPLPTIINSSSGMLCTFGLEVPSLSSSLQSWFSLSVLPHGTIWEQSLRGMQYGKRVQGEKSESFWLGTGR